MLLFEVHFELLNVSLVLVRVSKVLLVSMPDEVLEKDVDKFVSSHNGQIHVQFVACMFLYSSFDTIAQEL